MYKALAVLDEKLVSGDPQQIVLSFTYMGTLPTANPAYTPFVTCVAEYKSSKFDFCCHLALSPSVAAAAKILLLPLPIQNLLFQSCTNSVTSSFLASAYHFSQRIQQCGQLEQ